MNRSFFHASVNRRKFLLSENFDHFQDPKQKIQRSKSLCHAKLLSKSTNKGLLRYYSFLGGFSLTLSGIDLLVVIFFK